MTTERHGPTGFPAPLAVCPELSTPSATEMPDDELMWLRFDDRPFAVGDTISPTGYLPPEWQQLYERGQLRADRVYIVRAAGPDEVSRTGWNERRRWCYQVEPRLPLEQDPDPTHRFMISRMCRTATVISILRTPHAG
jgi:hypothetical protein